MVKDSVSNLITSIKNASMVNKPEVSVSYSNFIFSIVNLLKDKGFVSNVNVIGEGPKKTISIRIVDNEGKSIVKGVKRVSKFSKRIYTGSKDIKPVRNSYGIAVITTPQGILTDSEAKEKKVGGEVLFEIW